MRRFFVLAVVPLVFVAGLALRTDPAGATASFGTISMFYGAAAGDISGPSGLVAGPDGAVWFINSNGAQGGPPSIQRIAADGVVTSFPDPLLDNPVGLTSAPDGALWFANLGNDSIGRISMAGVVTNFVDSGIHTPGQFVVGSDSSLWFTN